MVSKRKKGKLTLVIIVVAIILILFAIFEVQGVFRNNDRVDINIRSGAGVSSVAKDLRQFGVIGNETLFKIYAKLFGDGTCKMGMLELKKSMSYSEILNKIEENKGNDISVTITEGYNISEVADILSESGLVNSEEFLYEAQNGSFDFDFVSQIPQRENRLDGYLYPDTYFFSKAQSAHEIIEVMLKNFEQQLVPLYNESKKEMSLDDTVILASMVEKESAAEDDRGMIASVFLNRLKIGKRLQSDATVQYAYKVKKADISVAETQVDTPYNTYLHDGLPIGPICSMGEKSFKAALYPTDTKYYYFIAVKDGSHSLFSETFEEHLAKQKEIQNP